MTPTSTMSLRFPRIDLPRSHAARMFIAATCDATHHNEEILRPLLENRDSFVSGATYTINGKIHLVFARAELNKHEGEKFDIHVEYDASESVDDAYIPREERRESEFIDRVLRLTDLDEIQCNLEFSYNAVMDTGLWFPLPSQIGGTADVSDTFLIVGVDAVKLPSEASNDPGYGFRLIRSPDGGAFLDLYFPLSGAFTPDLPRKSLAKGRAIANRLVNTRGERQGRSE